jgi:hypothetical protein
MGASVSEDFELIKTDLLEMLRNELGNWSVEPESPLSRKLLREAFMAAVAELRDDDFGGELTGRQS